MALPNKFLPRIAVQSHNPANAVAFKTPRVAETPPLLRYNERASYDLPHRLNSHGLSSMTRISLPTLGLLYILDEWPLFII